MISWILRADHYYIVMFLRVIMVYNGFTKSGN